MDGCYAGGGGWGKGAMDGDTDFSFGEDAPAAVSLAEVVEETPLRGQEHRCLWNSERLEAKEVEKEKSEAATQTVHGEGNACSNPSQLAIFFNGSVSVYDDIPLERVQAILLIAAATVSATQTYSPVLAKSLSVQSSSTSRQTQLQLPDNTERSICCKLQVELPIARRSSLQRFLEKRRERLVHRAPYPPVKSSESLGSGDGSESSSLGDIC